MDPTRPETAEYRNWAEAWHAARARNALEANLSRSGIGEEEFWARYAAWVEAMQGDYPDTLLERVKAYVRPDDAVLDIGAGAGLFAIPLSARSRRVTAVEPSPVQASRLRQTIEDRNARNVVVIERRWEDVDVETLDSHDIVIAVHSLQMPDIGEALRKMCRVASTCLLLVHSAEHSLSGILQELFGIEPGPDYTYLQHILRGLGYEPRVEFADQGCAVPLEVQLDIFHYNPGLNDIQCNTLRAHVVARGLTTVRDGTAWLRRSHRDALLSVTTDVTRGKESRE